MFDIVALGEALIDFTPGGKNGMGNPVYCENPGGAPANVLACASRLGAETAFIGKVGDDAFGKFMAKNLSSAGIDIEGLVFSSNYPTTLAFVSLNENGDRSFSFYRNRTADVMLETKDIKDDILRSGRVFHFGSVSMTSEPARSTTLYAVKEAKAAGAIISYDPNYRPLLWKNRDEAEEVMRAAVPYADILKVSDEELFFLTGTDDDIEGSKMLSAMGPKVVVVTKGEKGSFLRKGSYTASYPTINVDVVDTTGAGDTFLGALIFKLVIERKITDPGKFDELSKDDLDNAMRFANVAGSLSTRSSGAIPSMPSIDEIIDTLSKEQMK